MALRPVYSTQFLRVSLLPGGTAAVYSVPVGYVAVVKSITAVQLGTATMTGYFTVRNNPGGSAVTVWTASFPVPAASIVPSLTYYGMIVVPETGEMVLSMTGTTGQPLSVQVSGFLLKSP